MCPIGIVAAVLTSYCFAVVLTPSSVAAGSKACCSCRALFSSQLTSAHVAAANNELVTRMVESLFLQPCVLLLF